MIVVGHELLLSYVAVSYSALFTCLLGIILTFLHLQGNCRVLSENLVKKHAGGFHVFGIRGDEQSYQKRMWSGQLPLRIYCGEHFVIGKGAVMNYMDVLSSNATNLLVLLRI